jgi:hypothetical protein
VKDQGCDRAIAIPISGPLLLFGCSFSHDPGSGLAGVLVAVVGVKCGTYPQDGIIRFLANLGNGPKGVLADTASSNHWVSGPHLQELQLAVMPVHAPQFPTARSQAQALGRSDEIGRTLYVDDSDEAVKEGSLIITLERRGVDIVWSPSRW